MSDPRSLQGRRVLVTGAARGMGAAIAARIVADGGRVALADILTEEGRATAAEMGEAACFVPLDVTDATSWETAVAASVGELGGLDGLVNNAGILHLGRLEDLDPERIARIVSVNLVGPTLGVRAVAPVMRSGGGGSIVNISSVAGLEGRNATVAYTTSKWGVRGLTKAAAVELGMDGIRVNAVCPSMGNPEMFAPFLADMDIERFMSGSPTSKLHSGGRPVETEMADVAEMVAWLLSDAARTCTGADFAIDAGWTAGTFAPGLPGF